MNLHHRFAQMRNQGIQADVANFYTPAIWGGTGEVLPWLGA